ncbi:MAG: hypothetical protein ACHQ1H_00215 [Nitrososphaerales archaeon]
MEFADRLKEVLIEKLRQREQAKLAHVRKQTQLQPQPQLMQPVYVYKMPTYWDLRARNKEESEAESFVTQWYALLEESKAELPRKQIAEFERRFFKLLYHSEDDDSIRRDMGELMKSVRAAISEGKKKKENERHRQLNAEKFSKMAGRSFAYSFAVQSKTEQVDSFLSDAFNSNPALVQSLFYEARQTNPLITTREELRELLIQVACAPVRELYGESMRNDCS